MFEEMSPESIREEILDVLADKYDTREGSFLNDVISPVSYRLWQYYDSLNELIPIAFVDETSGEFLEKRAKEYGIERKEGANATVTLVFSGEDGAEVPMGSVCQTVLGKEFETTEAATVANGTAQAQAKALEIGEASNVAAGTIVEMNQLIPGIDSVTNPAAAIGGAEEETDEAFFARLNLFRQKPAMSGNANDYVQWALEVPGCGGAKCIPLIGGPGTVGVIIAGTDKQAVSSDTVAAVQEYIDSVRPVGADVTVSSAKNFAVNISMKLTINTASTTLDEVKAALREKFAAHLHKMAFEQYEVRAAAIGAEVMGTEGVLDYSALTLNGVSGNLAVPQDSVPVLGEVTLS